MRLAITVIHNDLEMKMLQYLKLSEPILQPIQNNKGSSMSYCTRNKNREKLQSNVKNNNNCVFPFHVIFKKIIVHCKFTNFISMPQKKPQKTQTLLIISTGLEVSIKSRPYSPTTDYITI